MTHLPPKGPILKRLGEEDVDTLTVWGHKRSVYLGGMIASVCLSRSTNSFLQEAVPELPCPVSLIHSLLPSVVTLIEQYPLIRSLFVFSVGLRGLRGLEMSVFVSSGPSAVHDTWQSLNACLNVAREEQVFLVTKVFSCISQFLMYIHQHCIKIWDHHCLGQIF